LSVIAESVLLSDLDNQSKKSTLFPRVHAEKSTFKLLKNLFNISRFQSSEISKPNRDLVLKNAAAALMLQTANLAD
jgi:hypothetical protein